MSTPKKRKGNVQVAQKTSNKNFGKLIIKTSLLVILIILSVLLIKSSLTANNVLSYAEKGNVDYKVYLKENNFYTETYLGPNMTYITSLVDYVDIDFNYNFNTSEKANMEYTYSIYANLVITPEDNSKVLFDETYILTDATTNELLNGNKYNVTKVVSLDYNYYNELANTFKSTYGVNCNSKLYVGLTVDTKGKDTKYENEFNNVNELKVAFSLAKKQVDIDMDSASLNNEQAINIASKGLIKNKGFLMLGLISTLGAIMIGISLGKTGYGIRMQKDPYTRYIEKILNNYDRAIVETQYIPNLDEYEVIEVGRFSELLDVRDTLRLPIIYSPIEGEGSCFYIRHESEIYIHYISCTSLVPVKNNSLFM